MDDRITKVVDYAREHVPFYETFKQMDFEHLPIIKKQMVLNNPGDFQSGEYQLFPLAENVNIRRTSGSTGQYLKIPWDIYNSTKALIEVWILRRRYYNILPQDPYCFFYTTNYAGDHLVEEKDTARSFTGKGLGFSKNALNKERIREIFDQILEFDPKWMTLQPSIAILLSQRIIEDHLPPVKSLTYMELSGEVLTAEMKTYIQAAFHCQIANQYGCNEADSIALECPYGHMHLITSNVYIEIMKEDKPQDIGEKGNICVTCLNNYAMPFIRYDTGDAGRIRNDIVCECGNPNPVLELTKGRDNDFVLDSSGFRIPAYIFYRPIEYINEKIGNIILQYQVIQNAIDDFSVKMVIPDTYAGWKDELGHIFKTQLKQPSLENSNFAFEFSHNLFPDPKTGKLAFFKSYVKEV